MTRDQETFRNYLPIRRPIRVEKAWELKNAIKIQMELYGKIEHQKLRFVPNEKQIIKTIDDGVDRELIKKHESEPIKYSWAEWNRSLIGCEALSFILIGYEAISFILIGRESASESESM